MSNPGEIFNVLAEEFDSVQYLKPGTFGTANNGTINRTFICWKATEVDADKNVFDYYLIEDDTNISFSFNPTLYLDRYEFRYQLEDATTGAVLGPSGVMLQQSQPASTDTGETMTSSLSTTVSTSGGFFAGEATGSVGRSVTMGQSVSHFVPGVSALNQCDEGTGCDGHFSYSVAESSSSQSGISQLSNQMLFQVKRSSAPNGVIVNAMLRIYVGDHDGYHGTHYFDDFSNAFGTRVYYNRDRGGFFDHDYRTVTISPSSLGP